MPYLLSSRDVSSSPTSVNWIGKGRLLSWFLKSVRLRRKNFKMIFGRKIVSDTKTSKLERRTTREVNNEGKRTV